MPDPPGPCVHPDVGAYALGLLEAAERTAYERHLITCAQCLRTLEGLAPMIELLGQVDPVTLLAEAELMRVRRPPVHPPGASITLFPRQRDARQREGRQRERRPHLRAWDEIDDRFRTPAPREPEVAAAPAFPARRKSNTDMVRRLVLVAAALTVVTMVSLVTIAARSSETDPSTVAGPPATSPPVTVTTTAAAPPPTTAPPAAAPAPPPRVSTSPKTGPPVARTRENPKPAPGVTRPDTIKSDPGDDAAGERVTGSDPATGAAAEVRLSRTASGLDVSLTVTGLAGPCECVLRVITTGGAELTALRWRMVAGQDGFTGLGSTTVERAAIDHFEIVDERGTVRVTLSSR